MLVVFVTYLSRIANAGTYQVSKVDIMKGGLVLSFKLYLFLQMVPSPTQKTFFNTESNMSHKNMETIVTNYNLTQFLPVITACRQTPLLLSLFHTFIICYYFVLPYHCLAEVLESFPLQTPRSEPHWDRGFGAVWCDNEWYTVDDNVRTRESTKRW